MNITKTSSGGDTILAVAGKIDSVTCGQFSDEIEKVFTEGFTKMILDFGGVEYISSAGLRVIIDAQKKVNSQNRKMEITKLSQSVKSVFDITGFTRILTIT